MTASTKKMAQVSKNLFASKECLPPQLFTLKAEAYLYEDEEFKSQKQLDYLKFISI